MGKLPVLVSQRLTLAVCLEGAYFVWEMSLQMGCYIYLTLEAVKTN